MGWSVVSTSPTLMCHLTISASCRPSPRSGSLKIFMARIPVYWSHRYTQMNTDKFRIVITFLANSIRVCLWLMFLSERERFLHRRDDSLLVRHVAVLETRQRDYNVVGGDPLHR